MTVVILLCLSLHERNMLRVIATRFFPLIVENIIFLTKGDLSHNSCKNNKELFYFNC